MRRSDEASNGIVRCEKDNETTSDAEKMSMVGVAHSGEVVASEANVVILSTPGTKARETKSLFASCPVRRMLASIKGGVGVTLF